MLNKTITLFTILSIVSGSIYAESKLLKGAVTVQNGTQLGRFRVFFGGYRTLTDEEGFFSFNLESISETPFYLLISEGAAFTYDRTNTISTLTQDPKKSYLFYVVNYITDENDTKLLVATPERLEARNFQILPDRCVVLPINPNCIDKLEPWQSPANGSIAYFPKIVLKSCLDVAEQPSIKSVLSSLELVSFHEKSSGTTKTTKNQSNQPVLISITR